MKTDETTKLDNETQDKTETLNKKRDRRPVFRVRSRLQAGPGGFPRDDIAC